jgi:hypothetical protein
MTVINTCGKKVVLVKSGILNNKRIPLSFLGVSAHFYNILEVSRDLQLAEEFVSRYPLGPLSSHPPPTPTAPTHAATTPLRIQRCNQSNKRSTSIRSRSGVWHASTEGQHFQLRPDSMDYTGTHYNVASANQHILTENILLNNKHQHTSAHSSLRQHQQHRASTSVHQH